MTPTDEATFITLWNAGMETAEIARQLGIPRGTVASRAHALRQQGKIQGRPKGGNYPRQKALARQNDTPAPHAPPAPPAPPASPAVTFVAVPEIQEILSIVKELQTRVVSLEQTRVTPALPVSPATPATPAPPATERKDVQQWTVRLSKALIDHLKAVAYERRTPPSQLLEELVWHALRSDTEHPL
jgi:hypothetical protein